MLKLFLSLSRIDIRLSGRHKCHLVRLPWYQVSLPKKCLLFRFAEVSRAAAPRSARCPWKPRADGGEPGPRDPATARSHQTPPLRAVGRTFEFTFPLPGPSNTGGRPPTKTKPAGKPPRKRSTRTPPRKANPKAQQTKPRPEPATTEVEAKMREPFEHDRKGNTSPERREQHRFQE